MVCLQYQKAIWTILLHIATNVILQVKIVIKSVHKRKNFLRAGIRKQVYLDSVGIFEYQYIYSAFEKYFLKNNLRHSYFRSDTYVCYFQEKGDKQRKMLIINHQLSLVHWIAHLETYQSCLSWSSWINISIGNSTTICARDCNFQGNLEGSFRFGFTQLPLFIDIPQPPPKESDHYDTETGYVHAIGLED